MKVFTRFTALLLVLFCSISAIAYADDSSDLHSTIRGLLEPILENFVSYQIAGNDSGYYICVTHDYAFDVAGLVMMGIESYDAWASFVDSTISFADSIEYFLRAACVENPNLVFVVIDDYGFNTPILIICNGEVVYDFVPAE